MKPFFNKTSLIAYIFLFLVVSCAGNEEAEKTLSSKELYQKANQAYANKNYDAATASFKQLEKEYPFSRYTKESLLKTANAQFEIGEYDDAANTLKRYMELYPGAADSDFALYKIGMCSYHQIIDPRRDHSLSLTAKKYFTELLNRYPNSQYATDAQIHLDYVHNQIAAKEMIIGRFYLNNDQYPAAINRFKYVIKHHQTTTHVKEALHRLVESYLLLGLVQPAYHAAALLGHNYPDSKWYHQSYALMQKHDPAYQTQKATSEAEAQSWWHKIL